MIRFWVGVRSGSNRYVLSFNQQNRAMPISAHYMKKRIMGLSALLSLAAISAVLVIPRTGKGSYERSRFAPAAASASSVPNLPANSAKITLVPVLGPPSGDINFDPMLSKLFKDFESGQPFNTVPYGDAPALADDYNAVNVQVPWHAFVYSEQTPMFAGRLNPSAPFQNRRGHTLGWLVVLESKDGSDSVALSQIRFSFTSSDFENSLGFTSQLDPKVYATFARGYKANGTVVDSGSGDVLVKRVAVFMWSRLYNGGDTQTGLNEVSNYVNGMANFTLKLDVFLPNGQLASRTVEVNPIPSLVSLGGNRFQVNGFGTLQSSYFPGGPWTDDREVFDGYAFTLELNTPQGFFRVKR